MRRKELIGRRVVDLETGTEVGIVRELIIDSSLRRMTGLLVEVPAAGGVAALSLRSVFALENDTVTIRSFQDLQVPQGREVNGAKHLCRQLIGRRVLTPDGRECGVVEDLVVDPFSGDLAGYELSAGLISDILEGRKMLPAGEITFLGRDVIITKPFDEL
ncbi:MAG TPA: hypothetical protein GXZ96_06210 [Firmicutes bacterium]|nr:hypothetical protein [Bacillota bacterium]